MTVKLAGLTLAHPLMNAAGTCKTALDLERFARSDVSAIVVGSITVDVRSGNPGTTYATTKVATLNSRGIPSRGIDYYRQILPQMVEIVHAAGKPLIVSIAGADVESYVALAGLAQKAGADAIEVNLSCPNTESMIICFTRSLTEHMLRGVRRTVGEDFLVFAKVSPYSDPEALQEMAGMVNFRGSWVNGLVCSNTFPKAVALGPDGKPLLDQMKYGGLGGRAMKAIGLGQVAQFRELLPELPIIGVGGIYEGQDIQDYLAVGATAVQAASAYFDAKEDPGVYSEILAGYSELTSA